MVDPTDLLRGPAGWLLAVLAANLAIVLIAWALLAVGTGSDADTRTASEDDAERGETTADGADDRIRCPNCRTENELGYRFCRECLAELPGRGRVGTDGPGPRRRPLP